MAVQPTSHHDWTIHSINIHGVFFERRCQKTVAESSEWKVRSVNYPVEFPPPNGPWHGKESTLDIRAECQRQDRLLTLLIECKKNNPDLVHWVFFPRHPVSTGGAITVGHIENLPSSEPASGWTVVSGFRTFRHKFVEADEARETRGDYEQHRNDRNKTKTSNAAVHEAAHQVALATQAIRYEEADFSRQLGSATPVPPMMWKRQVFLPAVVTSAHLFTCDFDPGDVDQITGEIPYDRATLTARPCILFEYALPRHLQIPPANLVATLTQNQLERFTRMNILVIHSENFAQVLSELAAVADHFFT